MEQERRVRNMACLGTPFDCSVARLACPHLSLALSLSRTLTHLFHSVILSSLRSLHCCSFLFTIPNAALRFLLACLGERWHHNGFSGFGLIRYGSV